MSARLLLWAGAIAFALWEAYAAAHWVAQGGGLGGAVSMTWQRIREDWFLRILVADHIGIAGTMLIFVLIDAARRGWSVAARAAYTVAYIALGTPALFGYLAERTKARAERVRA